jgi:hypothetical protein
MRKFALILCLSGFASLIFGNALASPSVQNALYRSIPCTGRIASPEEAHSIPLGLEESSSTQLSQIGYLTILLGVGCFSSGLLIHPKKNLTAGLRPSFSAFWASQLDVIGARASVVNSRDPEMKSVPFSQRFCEPREKDPD